MDEKTRVMLKRCRICGREFTHPSQYRLIYKHHGKYGAALDWRRECRWAHRRPREERDA